ncbi:MAG: hypothetical protein GX458_05010, partial [Phyllobacteriaceae bacterium]|nr:hypothetical protein [Phyllobacteriaceae bacterium]
MAETGAERRMIRPSFVEEGLECLRRRGLPTAPVLAAAGLPAEVTEPVSAEAYGRMWLALAETMDDEFFGLGGRAMRPGSFVLLCHALMGSATLERALRRALRFLAVLIDDPNMIRYHFDKAVYLARHGRQGPVWIDIPLDVQAAELDES